jgi:hypothetical protein
MIPSHSNHPFTVEDLNRLEAERATSGTRSLPADAERLLDLAILFRNALREIQASGDHVAKQIASRALNTGKKP